MTYDATDHPSARGIAIALTAICKALSAASPDFGRNLAQALASAEAAGLPATDLAFLRLLVKASTSAAPGAKG